jgi:hypothetical protein
MQASVYVLERRFRFRAAMALVEKDTLLYTPSQVARLQFIAWLSANIFRAIVSSLQVSAASGSERSLPLKALIRLHPQARRRSCRKSER